MQERHFCDARHTETCSININHCCGYYFYSSGTRSSQVSRQPAWLSLPPPLQPHSTTFPLPLTQIQLFSTSVLLLFEARSFFTVETDCPVHQMVARSIPTLGRTMTVPLLLLTHSPSMRSALPHLEPQLGSNSPGGCLPQCTKQSLHNRSPKKFPGFQHNEDYSER